MVERGINKQKELLKKNGATESEVEAYIGIPCDPTGAPLFEESNVERWIKQSESNPGHFGKHGLDAFMFSHHQNCQNFVSNKWDNYNNRIDNLVKQF
jgi:hypothetical protein